jgi:phospholipase/lecithinase/hemolysin
MNKLKALVCTAILAASPLVMADAPYSSVIAFGDSLSDNGNYYRLIDRLTPLVPGDGSPPPPYFIGRFSNGPVMVERLAQELGVPLIDYAVAGAKTGPDLTPASQGGPADHADPRAVGNGVVAQVQRVVKHQWYLDRDALYVVWAGPNDLFAISDLTDSKLVQATVSNAVRNLSSAVRTLVRHGARHILVPGLPDLGLTPLLASESTEATALSDAFNKALSFALDRIESESRGVDIMRFDVAGLLGEIHRHPGDFGFANATDQCILDPTYACLLTSFNSGPAAGYLFWDDVHPTAAGHMLLANKVVAVVLPAHGAVPESAGKGLRKEADWLDLVREQRRPRSSR